MTSCCHPDRLRCCPSDSEYSISVVKDSYVATPDERRRELPQCEEQNIGEGGKQRCVVHSNKVLELPSLEPSLIAYLPGPPPLQPTTSK